MIVTYTIFFAEFHLILREDNDITVHVRLCIFITVLGCTQPNFLSKASGIDCLIKDLTQLKLNHNIPSIQQVQIIQPVVYMYTSY